jgi:hypothetical protein
LPNLSAEFLTDQSKAKTVPIQNVENRQKSAIFTDPFNFETFNRCTFALQVPSMTKTLFRGSLSSKEKAFQEKFLWARLSASPDFSKLCPANE